MAKRVLIVDDEREIADLVAIWLDEDPRCAKVHQAHDLDAAVRVATETKIDVILLDLQVGDRLSSEILPALRRLRPKARIVIHTASRDLAHRVDVLGRGADLVVEKATISLPAVVEAVLGC